MSANATATVLPATGREVPEGIAAFTVSGMKSLNTYDGVAYTATLRLDGKIVGTIENEGHGGDTRVHGKTREINDRWAEAVATIADFTEDHGDFSLTYDADYMKSEVAAEWLITEYEEAKWLNAQAKKATVIKRADGQLLTYKTDDLARVAKAEGVETVTAWTGGRWVTTTV